MLSPAVAYMNLANLKAADLPGYFEQAKDTKGVIIDLRNYPAQSLYPALGAYLATQPTPFVSLAFPDLANPGAFRFADGTVPAAAPGPVHYAGRIVILVNEITQSAAEFTAMALRTMPGALVMGSETAGADGNVSAIALPGGITTMISGLGVFYPDHRPTQRVGIVADIVVKPTVKGVAAGRDEVLDAAVRLLSDRR
jgi:C-terminal processing protease CtpA/Prc